VVVSDTELDTGKFVVGNLEIVESHITDFLGNGTISSVLPTGQVIEVSCDGRILPERISLIFRLVVVIISDGLAWVLSRDHVMEDTETVSTTRVSMIVPKLAYPFVLWTHVGVGMRSDGMNLQIVPVTITI